MKGNVLWLLLALALLMVACGQVEVIEGTRGVGENITLTSVAIPSQVAPSSDTPIVGENITLTSVATRPTKVTPEPTLTPERTHKELIICQVGEPDSLFLYSTPMLDKTNIHHAIYENLITQRHYAYQAQGIEKLPNLDDGDATLQTVNVEAGARVVAANGDVVTLAEGVTVVNVKGEHVVFDGSPVTMAQLVVNFTLKPMVWSDGVPVRAADSVFSFVVNRDVTLPSTIVDTFRTDRTARYEETGDLTLRWTGLPGWLDNVYFLNVWMPLPVHQLQTYDVQALPELDEVARRPLSSGPFVVEKWEPGGEIQLAPNPFYYRRDEGLPYLDQVTFKFLPALNSVISQVMSGVCALAPQSTVHVDQAPFLLEAEAIGYLKGYFTPGMVWEHLDFGINSHGEYGDGNGRPDWFDDARTRQALAMCTDRQRIRNELMPESFVVWDTFATPDHPLTPPDVAQRPYDVAAANALLDAVGYLDSDGDGLREDPETGRPFAITLITTQSDLRKTIAHIVSENWYECGVALTAEFLNHVEMFAPGPDGSVFGRQFDVALFAWSSAAIPLCQNWLAINVTGPQSEGFGGWDNLNNTGWVNNDFDAACQQAHAAFYGSPAFVAGHQTALRIFATEMPAIPLFPRVKVAVTRPEVINFDPDVTQPSELWNLFELDVELEEDP